MNVGIVGLGRMGLSIAQRLLKAKIPVFGFDVNEESRKHAADQGIEVVCDLQDLASKAHVFWLMIPEGDSLDCVIEKLSFCAQPGDIIVDGGNSFFENTIRRHAMLAKKNIYYLDCGTSGGIKGKEIGFSLMIGGEQKIFEKLEPLFKAIAAPHGYGYMGPSGAGHYVKMVHNGVEYSLLQAYAEGFHVLKTGHYKDLDFEKITQVWSNGSVIRSWIVDLLHDIFSRDQDFKSISGEIGENMTGRWAIEEAHKQKISMDLLERALQIREESRKTGGDYATKIVAMLRNAFGGHEVKKK
ncbi:MAG: decarboxylating 6-phosphogluconate dehydrogenase [bacterium]